jgi:predicted N-acetyltransferase YhbS
MTGLRFRDARPGDRDAIRDLTLSAYQEYAAAMEGHWEDYLRNILATLADTTPAAQIIAEQEGTMLGAVLLFPAGTVLTAPNGVQVAPTWPFVRLLAVALAARGQGVGTALMRECMRRARQSGAAGLALHTSDPMQVALRIYERIGFVRAAEIDFHPAPGVTVKGYRYRFGEEAPS